MDKALTDIEAWPVMSMDPAYECGRCNVICKDSHIDLKADKHPDMYREAYGDGPGPVPSRYRELVLGSEQRTYITV